MSALRRETSDSVDELFRSRWGPSVRLATAFTGDRAVAEELVQEAFLEVSKRWAAIDNPAGYLQTTLVNRCRNHYRRTELGRRRVPPAPPQAVDEPELDEMWTALAGLAPRRRMALVLRFYEDLPIAEIARLLDCRPGTVSSLLHRGLADLRKVIDRA
jgi:RNA polymerase sigma factor (sigma-70 family)